MNKPAAFRATYSDLKLIKTRQCVQVIFELPLADFDAAYTILGGMPNPANETWFGIAPLIPAKEVVPHPGISRPHNAQPQPECTPPAGAKREWRDLQPAAQAGIRCAEPTFCVFLNETRGYRITGSDEAAQAVREICGVKSRVELGSKHAARVLWHQLDEHFQAWKLIDA